MMFSRKPGRPITVGEWFIVAGAALVLTSFVLNLFITNNPPTDITIKTTQYYLSQQHSLQDMLIKNIRILGLGIIAMSAIIIGIRLLRKRESKFRAINYLLAGLLICIYHLAIVLMFIVVQHELINLPAPNLKKMELKLNEKGLPLKNKAILSKVYAGLSFEKDGKRIEYTTESGELKLYEPTKTEIQTRESKEAVKMLFDSSKKGFLIGLYYWVAILFISVFLGLLTPIRDAVSASAY